MAPLTLGERAYKARRQAFGGTLLLALEILVAADLVRTVAVAPTLNSVLVLGLFVPIRTFLSFSLEIEIDGTWPWRRALANGAGTVKQATQVALEPGSHSAMPGLRTGIAGRRFAPRTPASRGVHNAAGQPSSG
jgi:Protein of unknown function (DUF1622)